jgi:hypothetical protein
MKGMWGIRRGNKVILERIPVIYRIIIEKNINTYQKRKRERQRIYIWYITKEAKHVNMCTNCILWVKCSFSMLESCLMKQSRITGGISCEDCLFCRLLFHIHRKKTPFFLSHSLLHIISYLIYSNHT